MDNSNAIPHAQAVCDVHLANRACNKQVTFQGGHRFNSTEDRRFQPLAPEVVIHPISARIIICLFFCATWAYLAMLNQPGMAPVGVSRIA
jgi:hypothetical protein